MRRGDDGCEGRRLETRSNPRRNWADSREDTEKGVAGARPSISHTPSKYRTPRHVWTAATSPTPASSLPAHIQDYFRVEHRLTVSSRAHSLLRFFFIRTIRLGESRVRDTYCTAAAQNPGSILYKKASISGERRRRYWSFEALCDTWTSQYSTLYKTTRQLPPTLEPAPQHHHPTSFGKKNCCIIALSHDNKAIALAPSDLVSDDVPACLHCTNVVVSPPRIREPKTFIHRPSNTINLFHRHLSHRTFTHPSIHLTTIYHPLPHRTASPPPPSQLSHSAKQKCPSQASPSSSGASSRS